MGGESRILSPHVQERAVGKQMLTQETVEVLVNRRVRLTVEAMAALLLYPWPSGEDELRRAVLQAAVEAAGRPIDLVHLPAAVREALPQEPLDHGLLERFTGEAERQFLTWAVGESGLPKKQLSGRLGITRSALYKKLGRYGITL